MRDSVCKRALGGGFVAGRGGQTFNRGVFGVDVGIRKGAIITVETQTEWVLVQFKPNSDAIAVRNLNRQGIEVFLPKIEQTKRVSGRFKKSAKALFPGYLFAKAKLSSGDWRAINSTYGVSRIVTTGSKPTPVPTGLVEAIKARCDGGDMVAPELNFTEGDEVRVQHGPFADWVGKVLAVEGEQRAWILLDFLGRETRVAVNLHDLDAV